MAQETVLVRYIARGASQVGAQALMVSRANMALANSVSLASQRVAGASRVIGAASGFAAKAVLFGIGAAFAISAKAAIDFESSLAGVTKTLGDTATTDEITALGEALRVMSLTTPVNVNGLLGIAEIGGQLGVGVKDMEEFVKTIAAMAVTTNLSAEDAAKGMARFANIMEIPIDKIGKLGSIIVHLGNNFATSESEILNFALRLAPIGKTVGASEEQILGLAAAFSQLGIPAERGGTAIQTTLMQIENAVATGGPKLVAFAKAAGMSVDQFVALDAVGRFTGLIDGLRDTADAGGSMILVLQGLGITQKRQTQTLLGAASARAQFNRAIDESIRAGKEDTALQEEAALRYGTTAMQIQLMANAFNDLRIEIGGPLIQYVRKLLTGFTALFQAMKDNTGMLKFMAGALAVLLGVKGLLALHGALKTVTLGFQQWRAGMAAAKLSADLTVTSVTAAKWAMLGLSLAMAAVTLVGLAFIAWQAKAKADAASLREEIQGVNDALESGDKEGVGTAWRDIVDGVLRPGAIDALQRAGISVAELSRSLAKSPDARPWNDIMDLLSTGPAYMGPGGNIDKAQQDIWNSMSDDAKGWYTDYKKYFEDIGPAAFGVMYLDRLTLSEDLKALNKRDLAAGVDYQQRLTDIELDGAGNRKKILEEELLEGRRGDLADDFGPAVNFADSITQGSDTDLQAAYDKLNESTDESMMEMEDRVADAFVSMRDDILSGIEYWDKYKGAVKINVNQIISNLKKQMIDLQGWNATVATMMEMGASDEIVGLWDSFDLQTKAGFTKLLKDNPAEFARLLTQWDGFLVDITEVTYEKFTLQEIIAQEMRLAIGEIMGASAIFAADNSLDPFETFVDQMTSSIAAAGPEGKRQLILALQAMNDSGVFLASYGIGKDVIQGLIDGIIAGYPNLRRIMLGLAGDTSAYLKEGFGVQSPSKVMMKIGGHVAEGFNIGLKKGMNNDLSYIDNHIGGFRQAAMSASRQPDAQTLGSSNSAVYNLTINGSGNPSNDGRAALLTAQMLGSF